MKKLVLSITLLLCLMPVAQSQEIDVKKIDSYISLLEKNNKAIGAVAIAKDGKQLYSRTFGQDMPKGHIVSSKPLKYQIGSVTKMLTATMILQLAEKNKIDLDDKIDRYFPDLPNAKKISINNLLMHNSGLGDFVVKNDSLVFWLAKPVSDKEIYSEIIRQGVAFEPGDSIRYSNTGYYLLTRILEKTYRKNYKAILYDNIIKPLRLTDTRSIDAKDNREDVAKSYSLGTDWNEIEDFYFPNVIGVGDVVTTPSEMNIITSAILNGVLISKESVEKMKPLAKQGFGKGLMGVPFYDKLFFGHGGDTFGTHSITAGNPDDGITVSMMINGEVMPHNDITIGLLSILYGKEYTFPDFTKYAADPAIFTAYEGTYSTEGFPLKIMIFKQGNDLMAQATGQSSFPLEPTGRDKFRFLAAAIEIEFTPEKKMNFTQGGNKVVFNRE